MTIKDKADILKKHCNGSSIEALAKDYDTFESIIQEIINNAPPEDKALQQQISSMAVDILESSVELIADREVVVSKVIAVANKLVDEVGKHSTDIEIAKALALSAKALESLHNIATTVVDDAKGKEDTENQQSVEFKKFLDKVDET